MIRTTAPGRRDVFLGVRRSLRDRAWVSRLDNGAAAAALAQRHGLHELMGRVLAGRGIGPAEAADFLHPSLRNMLPDPSCLRDMDKAAARLADAIVSAETMAVFGDYDVDGATSAALMQRFLAAVGIRVRLYIPDRITEGYGPGSAAFETLAAEGATLIVTVDCGTASVGPISSAARAGVDVIVIDHHIADENLPAAAAIINPNRHDDTSGLGQLAAVGVTFMVLVAVNRELRRRGWFGAGGRTEPDLRQWLDLVALGTICDVVPLTGINRAFAHQGLRVMRGWNSPGMMALGQVARLDGPPEAYHAGFLLGPRINAGGRVGQADLGVRLLTTRSHAEAEELAIRLDEYNRERMTIETGVQSAALQQAEAMLAEAPDRPVICVGQHGWHPGVIGIAAGRLKDRFNRPVIVIGFDENGQGKGSGRSITGVNLGAAVTAAMETGVIKQGGGHAMAAGLSLAREQMDEFAAFMNARLEKEVETARAGDALKLDGALTARGATLELAAMLEQAGPFGAGNPRPRFAFPAHRIAFADIVGNGHVRCTLRADDGARLEAIAFRAADTRWGQALLTERQMPLHIAGTLKCDRWQGREKVKLTIEDVARPGCG